MEEERELLKGNTPTLVLAVLSDAPLHGYGIAREIERRSDNALKFKEGNAVSCASCPGTRRAYCGRMAERKRRARAQSLQHHAAGIGRIGAANANVERFRECRAKRDCRQSARRRSCRNTIRDPNTKRNPRFQTSAPS